MSELTLNHNADDHRYEAWDGPALVGFAEYHLTDAVIAFTHTEVEPARGGQGIGSQIVRFALNDVRADGTRRVLPQCSFVKAWIDRHPDDADLVHRAPTTTD